MSQDIKEKINEQDIQRFNLKHGQKTTGRILSILGKDQQFYNAANSPIGQELLTNMLAEMEILLEKIIEDKATANEKADFRAYKEISLRWAGKINNYYKNLNTLKGV